MGGQKGGDFSSIGGAHPHKGHTRAVSSGRIPFDALRIRDTAFNREPGLGIVQPEVQQDGLARMEGLDGVYPKPSHAKDEDGTVLIDFHARRCLHASGLNARTAKASALPAGGHFALKECQKVAPRAGERIQEVETRFIAGRAFAVGALSDVRKRCPCDPGCEKNHPAIEAVEMEGVDASDPHAAIQGDGRSADADVEEPRVRGIGDGAQHAQVMDGSSWILTSFLPGIRHGEPPP